MLVAATDWAGVKLGATPYRVVRRLGETVAAEIFQAEDIHNGLAVTIKAIKTDVAHRHPILLDRLRREAPVLQRLDHPHLVRLIDLSEHNGRPFAVLPAFPAGNLWMRIAGPPARPGPKPADHLFTWLPAVASALDYLNAQGQVHGDVQPANIHFDANGQPYLSELALTRPYYDGARRTFLAWNAPAPPLSHYQAPELISGAGVDPRSDQFSLALIVWEWLTGRSLFSGDSLAEIRKGQETLDNLPNWLPAVWIPYFRKALARQPEQRFLTSSEFVDGLLSRMDASGAPVMDGAEPVNFDIFCGDSVTALDGRGRTHLERGAPQARTPWNAATPASALPAAQPEPMPVFAPTAPVMFAEEPPRRGSWLLRILVVLLLMAGAAAAGSVFLPETEVYKKLSPYWKKPDAKAADDKKEEEKTLAATAETRAADAKKLKELQDRVAGLDGDLSEAKQRRTRLEEELAALRGDASKATDLDKASKALLVDLEKARQDVKTIASAREEAEERVRVAKGEAETLKLRVSDLEARVKTASAGAGDATAARIRAESAERDLSTTRFDLEGARKRIAAAESAHRDFKAWFMVTNGCDFPIVFQTRTRFWDGSWSAYIEQRLEAGASIRIFCHGNIGAEGKWVNTLVGDDVRWSERFITGEIRPASEEPTGEQVDCRYRFVLRDRRIDLDFLYSVSKR